MYSHKAKKLFLNPHNVGALPGATHVGTEGQRGLGNYMVIFLRVEAGEVAEATFQTYGCPGAIACGCELTDMVTGRSVEEALDITAEQIVESLGGLPLGKQHCAALALGALRNALAGGSD
jgi:NifU-like protein involved in Fe-S cluster formation